LEEARNLSQDRQRNEYMCVCVCVQTHTLTLIYIYIYIYTHIHVHIHTKAQYDRITNDEQCDYNKSFLGIMQVGW